MTKISQLSSIGDSLAVGDQFLIRDIDDAGSPNKSVTVSGIMRAVDLGTVAAPAIAFATDKNTGIYSPGADQVVVSTNGTERLRASTTAVSSTLPISHPLGTVSAPSITFTGDLNTGLWSPAADALAASTNGAERLRIISDGKIGVGTSSPATLFNVNGDIALDTAVLNTPKFLQFRGNSDGTGGTPLYGGITWYNFQWDATKRAEITSGPDVGVAAGYLAFSTGSGGVSERLRITSAGVIQVADAGNITVGTTTGTKIGTATTQKLGFYNATPVVQPTAVANATNAADVITQLNDLLSKLRTLGIIAT